MQELKGRIKEVYDFIVATIEDCGVPPSVREICKGVGLSSPSSVHTYLSRLTDYGYIRKDSKKMRTISLTAPISSARVPILGKVTAGNPILAVEDITGYICYEGKPGAEYFALRISGDSMIGAGILDGDIVVVRRQESADNGSIVVALLDDEATVKRLQVENGRAILMPANPTYSPIDGSDCAILGKVCALMRDM